MGCKSSRSKVVALDQLILEREAELENKWNYFKDDFVLKKKGRKMLRRKSQPLKYSSQYETSKSKVRDEFAGPPLWKSEPKVIRIDATQNNLGLAHKEETEEFQSERQPNCEGIVTANIAAKSATENSSITVNILPEEAKLNVTTPIDIRVLGTESEDPWRSLPSEITRNSAVVSAERAISFTIPASTAKNWAPQENVSGGEVHPVQHKVKNSESIILEKDRKIQELLEENRKLKMRRHKKQISSVPLLRKNSTTLRDKIRDIKNGTNFGSISTHRSSFSTLIGAQSLPANFMGTGKETNCSDTRRDFGSWSSDIKSDNWNDSTLSLPRDSTLNTLVTVEEVMEPPLKFCYTREESKKRRLSMKMGGEQSNSEGGPSQWEYSELMII